MGVSPVCEPGRGGGGACHEPSHVKPATLAVHLPDVSILAQTPCPTELGVLHILLHSVLCMGFPH